MICISYLPIKDVCFEEILLFFQMAILSSWPHHMQHIRELFTVSGGLEMMLLLRRLSQSISICQAFQHCPPKGLLFPWEVTEKFWSIIQIYLTRQTKNKSSFVDIWLGSESICLCQMAAMPIIVKTLVVRYFNFEFILFVGRNVMQQVNITGFNGKPIKAHLNYLHLEQQKSIYWS